jgi:predicted nucleic acid-binding protein
MTLYAVDTSAWHRSSHAAVAAAWAAKLQDNTVAVSPPVRLEILYSARSAGDYDRLVEELDALHPLLCPQEAFDRAGEVQRRLAHLGGLHHRSVKIPDLLVAACAERADATVWHYDEDFDRIADITGQPTEWVAPRGSL